MYNLVNLLSKCNIQSIMQLLTNYIWKEDQLTQTTLTCNKVGSQVKQVSWRADCVCPTGQGRAVGQTEVTTTYKEDTLGFVGQQFRPLTMTEEVSDCPTVLSARWPVVRSSSLAD